MASSLLLQTVSTVCGIILPRLFIAEFGSAVNGTIASITQFLSYIVLFEAGVGGVVRASLYKPLAEKNSASVSSILKACDIFFRKVSLIFIFYTLFVAVLFPFIGDSGFDFLYTFTLVVIIALSTFSQYFFGLSRQILLHADQRRYIYSFLQIFTVILNAVSVVILIKRGASVHTVKLATALIYAIRPVILRVFVKRSYSPDTSALPDNSALSQKWNGFGHHTAYFLHSNTDVAVLTVAAAVSSKLNIADVSVYTVYCTIVSGMKNLVNAVSSGLESAFGNMLAKGEKELLSKNFRVYEFVSFTLTTVVFTCVGLLIVPFISVYTSGITDADYTKPVFALLITLSEAVFCLRIPYNALTLSAGHYKQTRNGAFAEAFINIALSVLLVIPFGLSGVAFATLAAMLFRTVQYAVYLSKNILKGSFTSFLMRSLLNGVSALLCILFVKLVFKLPESLTYLSWTLYAVKVFSVTALLTLSLNCIFCRTDFMNFIKILKNIFERKKS